MNALLQLNLDPAPEPAPHWHAGNSISRQIWIHSGSIAHMLGLQSPGLLLSVGSDGALAVCKLPWPALPATEPEWPTCSLVTDSHMQVSQA